MSNSSTAVITVVHGRHEHLALQSEAWGLSNEAPELRCVVAIDDTGAQDVVGTGCHVVHQPGAAGVCEGDPSVARRVRALV